jgi:hypothetical protein
MDNVSVCSEEHQQRQELFHAIFNLVLQSVHPSFNAGDDASQAAGGCVGTFSAIIMYFVFMP